MSTPVIAVTGASGFVGSDFCHLLQNHKIEYRALLRKQHKSIPGVIVDYNDLNSIKSALTGCNTLVHLIAKTHSHGDLENLSEYRRINVGLSEGIAQAASATGIKRIVFLSSIKANGEETKEAPFDHKSQPNPTTAYGISKLETESALQKTCNANNMELVVIRPPLIFSPSAKGNIASLRQAIERRLPLPLSSIQNKRTIINLHELCELILKCCEVSQAAGKTLLAGSETLSTPDLIRKIGHSIDRRPLLIPFPVSAIKFFARKTGRLDAFEKLCGNLVIDDSYTKQILRIPLEKP